MATTVKFYKFDGAGNDFVVIDNRDGRFRAMQEEVARICHRRFGVGADGLMTLERSENEGFDFEMKYYNSDGRLGSMCGNGGRCISAFAHMLGLGKTLHFKGYDGPHDAEIVTWDEEKKTGVVKLGMRSVGTKEVRRCLDGWFLDTGSPHYVQRVSDLEHFDVVGEGRRIRNIAEEFPQGTNVDFIEEMPDGRLFVRTYERGVEDETWACGTGVTACAIVSGNHSLVTRGGDFEVSFDFTGEEYRNVCLTGPVALNFTGTWTSSAR
jgi:diaminopimelate epimerase